MANTACASPPPTRPATRPREALTARLESDPFIIDNTPPRIAGLTAARNGGKLEVRWHAADALNNIAGAEYSLDGGEWTVVGARHQSYRIPWSWITP